MVKEIADGFVSNKIRWKCELFQDCVNLDNSTIFWMQTNLTRKLKLCRKVQIINKSFCAKFQLQ